MNRKRPTKLSDSKPSEFNDFRKYSAIKILSQPKLVNCLAHAIFGGFANNVQTYWQSGTTTLGSYEAGWIGLFMNIFEKYSAKRSILLLPTNHKLITDPKVVVPQLYYCKPYIPVRTSSQNGKQLNNMGDYKKVCWKLQARLVCTETPRRWLFF